jgi:preprotein translocase subunit SecE
MLGRKPAAPTAQDRGKQQSRQAAQAAEKPGRFAKLRQNIDDIISELKKVTWPTPEETRNLTIVVIGISATIGLLLAGVDVVLSEIYKFLSSLAGQ